jgi:hypothetical protein
MTPFLESILAFPTVFFTILMGVIMTYWLFVIVGAVGIDALDGDVDLSAGAKAASGVLEGGAKAAGGLLEGGAKAAGGVLEGGAKAAGVILNVFCSKDNQLKRGDKALILGYDPARDLYEVEPVDWLLPEEVAQIHDPAQAAVIAARARDRVR